MNLNQLRCFYYTVKLGCLSAAARELSISQPAVSKNLKTLQKSHDVRLIEPFGKGILTTRAGEALYEIAEQIFELEKIAEASIIPFQQNKETTLRIAASESFGVYYLPSTVREFSRLYPHVKLSVQVMCSCDVPGYMQTKNYDLGFLSYDCSPDKFHVEEIFSERLVVITSTDHPFTMYKYITPEDLNNQCLLRHENDSLQNHLLSRLIKKYNLKVNYPPYEFGNNEAIKSGVESGAGVAIMSEKVIEKEVMLGLLNAVPLGRPQMKRKFYWTTKSRKKDDSLIQSFLNIMRSEQRGKTLKTTTKHIMIS